MTSRRLRPIDLARAAGVSTQQVRNFADAGILPPTPRTDSGYRQFDIQHQQALVTYQALVDGFGLAAGQAIMHAVNAGKLAEALRLIDAGHAELHQQRQALQATDEALEAVAERPVDTTNVPGTGMRIGAVARLLGVRTSALRVWESAGLLDPTRQPGTSYRAFGPSDIRDAQMIQLLRQGHYPLTMIKPVLDGLRETGSSEALRAAIRQRRAGLTERARAMLAGASRLHHYVLEWSTSE
ncbi:DNA-binding transcriptional MerR regulator [Tamaricihabitans halophyticus]|uniref:DNA-binding transcriptional MerR regulator n=1 Tax=Tamaricihabitans halophyticus TaxID=1262583 RepID=A0A4V2SUX4_9PSEU|nr:MerR family transcriptional regulator [Tamaricihabitans halophyticus]TCP56156.1 DNA-binding transcriptional MerR regulator [Tamaricihabitans halophyticus]